MQQLEALGLGIFYELLARLVVVNLSSMVDTVAPRN